MKLLKYFLQLFILITFISAQEKILFIGNSFTFYWNLPSLVESMAKDKGIYLDIYQSTAGSATLKDHWHGKRCLSSKKIIVNNKPLNFLEAKKNMELRSSIDPNLKLIKDKKNLEIVQKAMFSSTNEIRGTSYRSRIDDPKYQFAGKTGTAQVKRISKRERELDLKIEQIPYNDRDHALYVAYGPYVNPRYAISIIVEHGGSGSKAAAPMAKELFKLIIDRGGLREKQSNFEEIDI